MIDIDALLKKRIEGALSPEDWDALSSNVGNFSRAQLYFSLKTGNYDHLHELARSELSARGNAEHWTVTPNFIVTVLAMLFAAIAAWPVIHEWLTPPPKAAPSPAPVIGSPQSLGSPAPKLQSPAP